MLIPSPCERVYLFIYFFASFRSDKPDRKRRRRKWDPIHRLDHSVLDVLWSPFVQGLTIAYKKLRFHSSSSPQFSCVFSHIALFNFFLTEWTAVFLWWLIILLEEWLWFVFSSYNYQVGCSSHCSHCSKTVFAMLIIFSMGKKMSVKYVETI